MPPYTPEELPPIRNELSKMMYLWITAYTFNTLFFAVNQSGPLQYMFDSDDVRMICVSSFFIVGVEQVMLFKQIKQARELDKAHSIDLITVVFRESDFLS